MVEAKDTDYTGSLLSFMVTDDALKLQPALGIKALGLKPGASCQRL